MKRRQCCGVVLALLLYPFFAAAASSPQPFVRYFGVYLKGHKVGWMRSELALIAPQRLQMMTLLQAKVSGMQQEVGLSLSEERLYSQKDGKLLHLSFKQQAPTGVMEVVGHPRANGFALVTTTAETKHTTVITEAESLTDALAPMRLAQQGKLGVVVHAQHVDPAVNKSLNVTYTSEKKGSRKLAGVEIEVIEITAFYPDLNLVEHQTLDRQGHVLEATTGSFFEVRSEPEPIAKRLDATYDLLQSSVVAMPTPLDNPQNIKHLQLKMQGLSHFVMPTSSRQQVDNSNDITTIQLQRQQPLTKQSLNALRREVKTNKLQEHLNATSILQSDAPALRNQAKAVAGNSNDSQVIIQKLLAYVYGAVKNEYVPAYSNALEVLRSKRGDCTEHSVLFVAMARALGIPARVAVGLVYWPAGHGLGWHAWAEVWNNGSFKAVDPTWNQEAVDATHIKLADGDPLEQARIVSILGNLKVVELHYE